MVTLLAVMPASEPGEREPESGLIVPARIPAGAGMTTWGR
jgi:hypothetical protein